MTNKKFKRLFFDIETSPNIVFSWNVGRDISLDYSNILKERAVICICYKYEGDKTVHALTWNKGDDKQMLEQFAKIINQADEVIGHNSDSFDIKWIRARCILHGISIIPDISSLDTLKIARNKFRFNSNKLDYLAQYFGFGSKIATGFGLWKDIVLDNDPVAMAKMVKYCKNDVILLEKIFQKLNPYILPKTNKAILTQNTSLVCPECLSPNVISNGLRYSSTGTPKYRFQCKGCNKYFTHTPTSLKKLEPETPDN